LNVNERIIGRRLAVRILDEVRASDRDDLRGFMVDDITLGNGVFGGPDARLVGALTTLPPEGSRRANAPRIPGLFELTVFLREQPDAPAFEDVDPDTLLPPVDKTGWLTVDLAGRRIIVDAQVCQEPGEEIYIDWWGNITAISDESGHKAPDRARLMPARRTHVHGEHTVAPEDNRGPTYPGALRRRRRTDKRRPPQ
jgi:hypothetical protein